MVRQRTKQRHKQRRLPRSRRANDQVDMTPLEGQLIVNPERETPASRPGRPSTIILTRPGERRIAETDDVRVGDGSSHIPLIVGLLSEGVEKFGLGATHQYCLNIDRSQKGRRVPHARSH